MKTQRAIRVGVVSLGCPKNLVDSEIMLGSLSRAGLEVATETDEADVLIVNTCSFISDARQESVETILKAARLRQAGGCKALIVAGCLSQRYPKELQRELAGVDAIIGLNEAPRVGEIVREVLERGRGSAPRLYWSGHAKFLPDAIVPRFRLTPPHFAYVKIAEGCNHACTFCSIPRIRGRYRSRPVDDVLAEIEQLIANGVREVILIAEDTTSYGTDLRGQPQAVTAKQLHHESGNAAGEQVSLSILLRAIQQMKGDFWVRLLYTHPAHWNDELIETIGSCNKICRYVDMPLQHINDEILAHMRRRTTSQYIRGLVRKIRSGIRAIRGAPVVALRTTFIVGFPGETEEQFEELLEFIEATRFERVGIFKYSREDKTPAGTMKNQLSDETKESRYHRAMRLQQQLSREVQQGFVGQTLRVLVEKSLEKLPNDISAVGAATLPPANRARWWVGRSHADAPDIDGLVYVRGEVTAGHFAEVRITGATEYDLVGEAVAPCAR